MSRAVMQQALDALAPFRGDGLIIVNQAIAALQSALAQPEPEPAKPLTDEQIDDACSNIWGSSYGCTLSLQMQRDIARAIEAAHGIRPKGLFIDLIATHKGLTEELAAIDAPEVRRARPDDTEGGAP